MELSKFWWLPFGKVPGISPEKLHQWLKEDRPVQIVDARTGLEYERGTIDGAEHTPVTEMPETMKRLDLDKDQPVVVLCLSGHRSRPGVRWLRAHGYEAYNLEGGVSAWKQAGYTLEEPSD